MSSYRTVMRKLAHQRSTDARIAAVQQLKRVREAIAKRQQAAEESPVRPHDTHDQAEALKDAKARADERVQSMLGEGR